MEMQLPAKGRRVYSVEPKKVAQTVFTRNYLNYLVPALMKISKERSTSNKEHIINNRHCDNFKNNVVKYEVDMAMVFSAQGFAWSDALKAKLQRDHSVNNNEARSSTITATEDYFSSNPISKSKYKDIMLEMKEDIGGEGNEDDEVLNGKLRRLKKLIPGGEGMCNEQMVAELQSYISCLQMQVNILQCLAETP